eukprot:scaffold9552_cov113-Isochrysis_galbana.AAC.4
MPIASGFRPLPTCRCHSRIGPDCSWHARTRAPRAHTKIKLVRLKKPRLPSAFGLSGACGVAA